MSFEDAPKQTIKPESLVKGLVRFFNGDKKVTLDAINEYLSGNPLASKGEIFAALSGGKGKGKPHFGRLANAEDGTELGSHTSKFRKLSRRRKYRTG